MSIENFITTKNVGKEKSALDTKIRRLEYELSALKEINDPVRRHQWELEEKIAHCKRKQQKLSKGFAVTSLCTAPSLEIEKPLECKKCKLLMTYCARTSHVICKQCGYSFFYIDITSNSLSYGEDIDFTTFSYKRINHFNKWILLFQAKENTQIPEEIYARIMTRLHRRGHTNPSSITRKEVNKVLVDLNLSKYYQHKQLILARLTGRPPLQMTPEQEEICRLMFMATQPPFEKWKPIVAPERKNYLSYSYLLYKFCELQGWNEFLPYFTLLKGAQNRRKQDLLFEKICQELDWEFKPSARG